MEGGIMIDCYLICIENGKRLSLSGFALSQDGKRLEFSEDREIEPEERTFSKDEVRETIVQFLLQNYGKAVALVPTDDTDVLDNLIDMEDVEHGGQLNYLSKENTMTSSKLLNLDGAIANPHSLVRKSGAMSPMVMDCIDKAISRFDWTETINRIMNRETDPERRKYLRECLNLAELEE